MRFEPRVPQASMVHCYLFAPKSHIERAHAATIAATGARLFNRLRGRGYLADVAAEPVDGSVCAETWYFEWSFGSKNGAIDAELIVEPWRVFLDHLVRLRRAEPPKTVAQAAAQAQASAAKPAAAAAALPAKATRK